MQSTEGGVSFQGGPGMSPIQAPRSYGQRNGGAYSVGADFRVKRGGGYPRLGYLSSPAHWRRATSSAPLAKFERLSLISKLLFAYQSHAYPVGALNPIRNKHRAGTPVHGELVNSHKNGAARAVGGTPGERSGQPPPSPALLHC
jgi:hypothetical protein